MAKPACKCKKHAECEECPEWIFTFADLVMLMMGFFVILWVLKPSPGKQGADQPPQAADQALSMDTIIGIRTGFGWLPDPSSSDPVNVRAIQKRDHPEASSRQSGNGGDTREPKQGAEGTHPLVTSVRPGQYVAVGGTLLFDPGDARLTAETNHNLDEIFQVIKGHRFIVLVKGHASLDDVPDRSGVVDPARSQQQMDLSLRRAQAAAGYLITLGLSPDVVRVEGCSTYEPLVQKDYSPGAQIMNRRVEVESTDVLVPERQDRAAPTTVPALPIKQPATGPV